MQNKESDINEQQNTLRLFHPTVTDEKHIVMSEEEQLHKNIENLIKKCQNPVVKRLRLTHINRQLEDFIRQCDAVTILEEEDMDLDHMKPKDVFAPNEKLDHQPKFFKTKKSTEKPPKLVLDRSKVSTSLKSEVKEILIPRTSNAQPNDLLLQFGAINVYYSSLLSLETNFENSIGLTPKRSRVGWLTDEIIDSFLFNLCQKFPSMIFCGCIETTMLSKSRSIRLLWKDEPNLENKKIVIIPFNQGQVSEHYYPNSL